MEAPEFRSQALCEKIVPHVTVDAITSICNAFDSKGFLLSTVEKTWSATNGLSYDDEVQCGPALFLL